MPKLRESPDESARLLESIARETARLTKRLRACQAANLYEPTVRLTNRLRALALLRKEAELVHASAWRIATNDDDPPAPDSATALVSSIDGTVRLTWPTATALERAATDLLEDLQ